MTFFIIYYSIGLIAASIISVGAYFILGKQGIYEIYKGDYPNSKLSTTEVNVYAHIAIFLILPLAYGYYILQFALSKGDKVFKKFWRKYVAQRSK